MISNGKNLPTHIMAPRKIPVFLALTILFSMIMTACSSGPSDKIIASLYSEFSGDAIANLKIGRKEKCEDISTTPEESGIIEAWLVELEFDDNTAGEHVFENWLYIKIDIDEWLISPIRECL
jgi:hypothetical protein